MVRLSFVPWLWMLPFSLLIQIPAADAVNNALFPAPYDQVAVPDWLRRLGWIRDEIRRQINYNDSIYLDQAVNWTRLSYVQPQVHLFDKFLYDSERREYTVERFLNDVSTRYGGIDSILLWPTYPNIGIDARNQADYFRALPGGLAAFKDVVSKFKEKNIRVLLAYSPWDQGTRDEGAPQWDSLVNLIKEVGADGFNGDTMKTMYRQYWDAGVEAGYHVVGEMEFGGYPTQSGWPEDATWTSSEWSLMGWGYFDYRTAPGVDKLKWLDSRRMTHVCDRWQKNRTEALHHMFFNGLGYESWENVWGVFMHFTERDGEALRRISALFRWLGRERFIQDYAEWEPYTPDLFREQGRPFSEGGLVGSKFVHESGDCVWLVVNRASSPDTAQINVSSCQGHTTRKLYNLYAGSALPSVDRDAVHVPAESNGYAALLASSRSLDIQPLLLLMRSLTAQPLETFSAHWEPLKQRMARSHSTPRKPQPERPGMVLIPETDFRFRTAGVEIEGGCDVRQDTWGVCCPNSKQLNCPHEDQCKTPCALTSPSKDSRGVDVQFPWEKFPNRFHDKNLKLGPFFIDEHLVTNDDFAKYLNLTDYKPVDEYNFLVGWQTKDSGAKMPAPRQGQKPVTWVSLSEARKYCAWKEKRLPHSYEWQLAAQGPGPRLFPWGNSTGESGRRFPEPSSGPAVPDLPDIGSFSPAGDSPFGVADLVGHVWQYTDEFEDNHTRTVMLKGSSLYTPMVSADFPSYNQSANWYFPKAQQVDRHGRMMLMDDSYERAATLGFRCVADHPDGPKEPYHYWETEGEATTTEAIVTV